MTLLITYGGRCYADRAHSFFYSGATFVDNHSKVRRVPGATYASAGDIADSALDHCLEAALASGKPWLPPEAIAVLPENVAALCRTDTGKILGLVRRMNADTPALILEEWAFPNRPLAFGSGGELMCAALALGLSFDDAWARVARIVPSISSDYDVF